MNLKFSKEIYSRTALLKAAYHFTDKAYLHFDVKENYYLLNIEAKEGQNIDEREFINELLAQMVRQEILVQTKEIREISLARALASSIIEEESDAVLTQNDKVLTSEILKDWFEENE